LTTKNSLKNALKFTDAKKSKLSKILRGEEASRISKTIVWDTWDQPHPSLSQFFMSSPSNLRSFQENRELFKSFFTDFSRSSKVFFTDFSRSSKVFFTDFSRALKVSLMIFRALQKFL
jgi:hypothetical protein